MISESESEAQTVLGIGTVVGQGSPHIFRFKQAQAEIPGEEQIQAAANFESKGSGADCGAVEAGYRPSNPCTPPNNAWPKSYRWLSVRGPLR